MPRDWRLFLGDMAEACHKIVEYRCGIDRLEFDRRGMAFDAIVRNVEILGEAAGKLPTEARQQAPEIPWDAMIGMRHRIAHAYFGIDNDILWDVVENEVPHFGKCHRTHAGIPNQVIASKSTSAGTSIALGL